MNLSHRAPHPFFRATFIISALVFFAGAVSPALADSAPLAPQTKIRLTVVQWMPSKGQFERWDAIGGEYTVSDAGEVSLPFLGSQSVGSLDSASLTNEIAKRLQAKMGLAQAPAVTIDVLEYPPIYVVGDVTTPGQYSFRPGVTVLQSLAMSGGPRRAKDQQQTHSTQLVGELREINHSILRSTARLARLQAEMDGAQEITFDQMTGADQQFAAGIYNEERIIFRARANALERQARAFTELRDLLTTEISTLEEKLTGADDNIKSVNDQLVSVKSLVQKGLTVSSRQLDLERLLTTYRSDKLDLVTAVMRGRQAISETTRNLEGLYDARRSEVATEAQSERASLDQMKMKRETTQKLLIEDLGSNDGIKSLGEDLPLTFSVTRRNGGQIDQFEASETTTLAPGDVVRVVQPHILDSSLQTDSARSFEAQTLADRAGQ
ncbi:polysaccharide biosynthesis/export family protein [Rhizobium ruizarguesonis]|jgi:polysaccharide export outer membrane protein|uniref:Exopolysaccharide biosynthesis protein n=1 Tax=Rhizobium ruizarguesonis TaxID=2081791 RepID=A0AAE8Q6R2_9HYPH|nr:polysaccharide biosynthesis/export family protein [Rhizobium ruizarguesonis]MBY5803737.1 exopolysaccharide biosynthesis protein [Rhizobium leguminosarum]NKL10695.1 exopolysaccharide biosynthesis protein [Rhizobium leguminosarum bv. viciae]QIO48863.1 exopolysaccharide biosynthesis protein [Rhizobium leguminosarum bv. trifolii]QJS31466.1 exopolysaccharide biosynthesis protein [Rhizobium leguminosarum bv. trifolii TA1]MBC2807496.1 exopolysaccharide biosynthesis protein [Rhizobium ruizarguesoni